MNIFLSPKVYDSWEWDWYLDLTEGIVSAVLSIKGWCKMACGFFHVFSMSSVPINFLVVSLIGKNEVIGGV